jgi:hypothetical protein
MARSRWPVVRRRTLHSLRARVLMVATAAQTVEHRSLGRVVAGHSSVIRAETTPAGGVKRMPDMASSRYED